MDDRFHNEKINSNGGFPDSDYSVKNLSLGDFSVNIDSDNGISGNTPAPSPKKFEVHIPDYDVDSLFDASVPQTKARPAAQQRKAAPGTPVRRTRPANAPAKGNSKAVKNGSSSASKTKPAKKQISAQQYKKAARRYDIIKNLLVSCVCIIFISIIVAAVSTVALGFMNDILVISDDTEYSAVVEIPEGATYDEVFDILCDKGLVRQPFLTDFFLRFRHYDQIEYTDNETGELKTKIIEYEPGMYYLNYSDGIENMIESIMVKNNYAKDTVRLTFPEGWTIAQIFEKIEKYEVCTAEKLYANLDIVGEQYSFIKEIEKDGSRYLTCEGYLFPDTYDFFIDESPSSVLKKLFNNFESRWSDDYDERLKELGMTKDEIIIIASIIQREAKDGSQMKDISSVIHNRLNDSSTYPRLEMNSTSDYILSLNAMNMFSSQSYFTLYYNKYYTYDIIGYPPGPICNPGKTAINAALYPSDTDYYFFCHDKSGNVYYATTDEQHELNKLEANL
ncbi:MAG: endolytic transglycosylase MltG [Clostridia bacterium]|nr:endolytic transglycosylase MltG [Clostridia bacterium]